MNSNNCGSCKFYDKDNAFKNLAGDEMSECLNKESRFRFVYEESKLNCKFHEESITWIKCTDRIPEQGDYLIIRKFNGVIKRQSAWIFRVCSSWYPELYEWIPYTEKDWKELNEK